MSFSVETYGDYQLLKKLASGGMASIYLARQQGLEGFEKLLVVKRILPHLAENEEFITMFLDEARIAARLNHPNIVQIFNLGAQDDSYFIAMEYIHGEDVRRIWKRADARGKPIPIPLVCRIIMDAAAGLDYAHKKTDNAGKSLNIVHRDISPQNILVTFEGGVKVVDFGIAKAADQATVTKSGVLKGKYSYMSPEQASGDKIDARSDIFALGVVLYELLTGARLFKRSNDIQTLNAVCECVIAPPSTVNTRVPKDLDPVVMKALAKKREDRYQDAGAMQAGIEEWLLHNKLPSSSVHVANFMKELYADRLAKEAEEGRVLVEELDRSRNPEDPAPSKATKSGQQKATGASRASRSASAPHDGPDLTRAERSQNSKEKRMAATPEPSKPKPKEGLSGPTESIHSVTEAEGPPQPAPRFPYVWAALLVVVGAGLGAWLVLRSGGSGSVVRLQTDPPGAQVTINGVQLPDLATPCALPKMAAGTYPLALSKKGYEKLEVMVTFPEHGEVTLPPFRLQPVAPMPDKPKPPPPNVPPQTTATVTVKSTPAGAIAWLDGRRVGPTPLTVELPAGGNVPLKLELERYNTLETTFNVPDEGGEQSFTLEEKPKKKGEKSKELGTVRFKVEPWATVECGELKLGDTPFPDKQLPAGTYRCTFTNPDFKSQVQTVKVEPNATTKVIVNLKP